MTGLLATKPRIADVPALAEAALWQELELTPKPGLVDKLNNGSHRDMDHALFARSIAAITPWFARFAELGNAHADKPADAQLRIIRPMGMACEQAMYAATNGVNTHKGGIFALGLLCFAAGRVNNLSADSLCCEVGNICRGLVSRELAARSGQATANRIMQPSRMATAESMWSPSKFAAPCETSAAPSSISSACVAMRGSLGRGLASALSVPTASCSQQSSAPGCITRIAS